MAEKFIIPDHWPKLLKIIECFCMSGCELHDGPSSPFDEENYKTRFLLNTENDLTANLSSLEDDTRVSPAEIEGWERDLNLIIPKPWNK